VLELLSGPLLVTVSHGSVIDLADVGETIDDKGPQQDGVGDLVALNRQTRQIGQGLKFGDLYETIDVVVLEEEAAEALESLQF